MNEKNQTAMNKLSQTDIKALESIYHFRCLNEDLLYLLHYNQNSNGEFQDRGVVRKKIRLFKRLELIRLVTYEHAPLPAIFLTTNGVNIVRESLDLLNNVFDNNRQIVRRGYYRASELDIYKKNINHQIHLNSFVVNLKIKLKDFKFDYYDEKYVSQYSNIRPDGLIQLFGLDFFLEMDMGTESKNQLRAKWDNYRSFLMSNEYYYRDRNIILLFILPDTSNLDERKDTIMHSISDRLLDIIGENFEIYIGTKNELIDMIINKVLPSIQGINSFNNTVEKLLEVNHGFITESGETIKQILPDSEYAARLKKVNHNGNIIVEKGKVQEFLYDDYKYRPTSIIKRISYHDKNNDIIRHYINRDMSYLILVDKEEVIFHDLKIYELLTSHNIYFTTFARLKAMIFCEAIFQFDLLGNIYHFSDNSLLNRVYERTLVDE